ncbi:MAG: hypothetical protein OK422_01460 [Thaumarchaeota archaeon]|nr:hypothetical protein [Nitrososphaerota archaeon]
MGKSIPQCETCADIADRGFEARPNELNELATEFLNHTVQNHAEELLALLAEKYIPVFISKRAMR